MRGGEGTFMLDRESILLIDVPPGGDNGFYVEPVRDNISPLDVLLLRMEQVVPRRNIVLLTGKGPAYSIFNRFVATRNLHMFTTDADHKLKRVLVAVSAHRLETVIRVSADNTFADPALVEGMAAFHNSRESAAYTYCENAPAWASGEVIGLTGLQKAFDITRLDAANSVEPGVYFRRNSGDFDFQGFKAPARRWPSREYSLANADSRAVVLAAIRRLPDPASVPASELPG